MAVIPADIDPAFVKRQLERDKVQPCGPVPDLTAAELDRTTGLVAQMGPEPFQRALEMGADIVIAGRSCDTSMFAAVPLMEGYPAGLTMHMAKLIECTSAIAEPGGRDAALARLYRDRFEVESMNPDRRCTPTSVAAHSLYEQADPFLLGEPGGAIDLRESEYEALNDRRVAVRNSAWRPTEEYWLKLEGARFAGYRFIAMGGVRDPRMIGALDTVADGVREVVNKVFSSRVRSDDYSLTFRFYGRDGVMGALEPAAVANPQEAFVLIDVVAKTKQIAKSICGVAKQYFLHLHYPGILCTSGNLAHPFSPDVLDAGLVYEFNVYHLVQVDDPLELFPIELRQVG